MQEPKYRIENGRKIYTMEDRIDCVRRSVVPKATQKEISKTNNSTSESAPVAPSSDSEDPDVVSVHMRLITAANAFPSVGWLGPQLVKYGHNDGQANDKGRIVTCEPVNEGLRGAPPLLGFGHHPQDAGQHSLR